MTIRECSESGTVFDIPTEFGQYQVVKVIGTGSTAVVIQLLNVISGNHYAAKVVSREALTKNGRLEYFEREVRVLQNITHPNIVKVIDIVYQPKIIMVVMEYCMYGDLLTFLTERRVLPPSLCRHMFYQIVLAVDHLHQRNYVHRDLKLENLFVNSNYDIKLGDFGLTKEAFNNNQNLLSTVCGTLYYTAPEIVKGVKYDGKKADVWSLGIILYCLAVGSLPWTSSTEAEIREEIIKGELNYPDTLYPEVLEIIKACCVVEPEKRCTVEGILEFNYFAGEKSYSKTGRLGIRGFSMNQFGKNGLTSNGIMQKKDENLAFLSAQMILHKPIRMINDKNKSRDNITLGSVAKNTV